MSITKGLLPQTIYTVSNQKKKQAKEVKGMEVIIKGKPKEIADLALQLKGRRKFAPDHKRISFEKKEFMNLMKKYSKSRSRLKF